MSLRQLSNIEMAAEPELPVPISYIGSKYLIFDIDAVTWLRKTHHICGVTGGTLPQSPSQNIFLGLPVQIMPEEAQLLVEKGVGYIVDDAKAHDRALREHDSSRDQSYLQSLRVKGEQVSIARNEEKEEAKRQSLKQPKPKGKTNKQSTTPPNSNHNDLTSVDNAISMNDQDGAESSLFDSTSTIKPTQTSSSSNLEPHGIVPTISNLWLPTPPTTPSTAENMALLPNVPSSYALYKHLNSKSYFMTPGLRFGCQYCVYPGDPLRFHSHFLAVGREWDQEINLMDIVGGGRLGTGVKKGFLIGGREPAKFSSSGDDGVEQEGRVRTFSIEWAAI